MGNGSSIEASKIIYVEIEGKEEKVVFSRHCSSLDISQLLAQAAGISKNSQIALRDKDGAFVTISPTMPTNTPSTPYKVAFQKESKDSAAKGDSGEVLQVVLTQVAEQFNKSTWSLNRAFKVEEMRNEISSRLTVLEKRMEMEGLKLVEVDKCRKEINEIKTQIFDAQRKMVDHQRLRSTSDRCPDAVIEGGLASMRPQYFVGDFWYTLSQETVDYLKQPTFDIWHWEPNEMLSLLEHMYHELGLVQEFNINPITLKRWLLCVQENYRNNPFHNFRHCFCVTQMMYGMINLCELWEKVAREDLGILLTAAVCHDLDHPGYNNTYQINARTELAIRYNDISPLENHHCAVAFQILSNPETNIFSNMDAVSFKRIRSGIITLVLATDMARHGEILNTFKSKLDNFEFSEVDHVTSGVITLILATDMARHTEIIEAFRSKLDRFDFSSEEHLNCGIITLILATDMARHGEILSSFKEKLDDFDFTKEDHLNALKMVMIKCCDISNEVRPMTVSEPWVDCLLEEYFNQSDREKQEGLPVAPFMDRDKVTKPTAQIGFIKFVLIPMFETMAKLFTVVDDVMVKPLKAARDHYEAMKAADDARKAEAEGKKQPEKDVEKK